MCKLKGAQAVHREPSWLAEGIPDYIAIDVIGVVPCRPCVVCTRRAGLSLPTFCKFPPRLASAQRGGMLDPDVAGTGAGAIAVRGRGFRIWTCGEAGCLVIRTCVCGESQDTVGES